MGCCVLWSSPKISCSRGVRACWDVTGTARANAPPDIPILPGAPEQVQGRAQRSVPPSSWGLGSQPCSRVPPTARGSLRACLGTLPSITPGQGRQNSSQGRGIGPQSTGSAAWVSTGQEAGRTSSRPCDTTSRQNGKGPLGRSRRVLGTSGARQGAVAHPSTWTAGIALRDDSNSPASSTTPTRTGTQNQKHPSFVTKIYGCAGFGKPTPAPSTSGRGLLAGTRLSPGTGKRQTQPTCLGLKG